MGRLQGRQRYMFSYINLSRDAIMQSLGHETLMKQGLNIQTLSFKFVFDHNDIIHLHLWYKLYV